jgi:3-hydroxyisobutyrate dehydrogenase
LPLGKTTAIAFLGLGNMGAAMALRLLRAGYSVRVCNRTISRARKLVPQGAVVAATPREAADGARVVFAMVSDDRASREVWLGRNGALAARLAPGAYAVDCSTLSAGWIHTLAARATARQVRFIDCPVTGIPSDVEAGRLILFVGAGKADVTALRPVFEALAKEFIHFGPVGAGNAYKLMINLMGSVQIAALAEGLVMAERAGLKLDRVVYALLKGAAASPQVIRNAQRMLEGKPGRNIVFSGRLRLKDTRYGVDLARRLGFDARFGKVALRRYQELVDSGFGEINESKIIDTVRGNSSGSRR